MESSDQNTGQGLASDPPAAAGTPGGDAPGSGTPAPAQGGQDGQALHDIKACGEHLAAAVDRIELARGNPHMAGAVAALDRLYEAVAVLAGVVAGLVLTEQAVKP